MLSQSDGNDLKTLSNIVACFSSDLTRSYEVASLLKIVYALCKGILLTNYISWKLLKRPTVTSTACEFSWSRLHLNFV